jgi:catechol 2,3-dioxygenase-like lactoylglutathione lyase family enzyme
MLRVKALDHVGLKVADMDKTLDFYRRLGLRLVRASGPHADGLRTAVIAVGSQELNVFSHPDFMPSGKENPVGMDHFCIEVDAASIDAVIADLRDVGIDVAKGPERRRDGTALFVHDPDGVRVELQLRNPATA